MSEDGSKDTWIETSSGRWVNLSRACEVQIEYAEDPDASDVRAGNLTGRAVSAAVLAVRWSPEGNWTSYRLLNDSAEALEHRLSDHGDEVADLHQIVRLLNERLAKLERG